MAAMAARALQARAMKTTTTTTTTRAGPRTKAKEILALRLSLRTTRRRLNSSDSKKRNVNWSSKLTRRCTSIVVPSALAEDENDGEGEKKSGALSYNPQKGQELSKLGGSSLLVIVAVYGFSRLLARRASYFSKVKLASRNEDDELLSRSIEEALDAKKERAGESPKEKKGPKDVFTNAATVGGIFVVLYIISSNLDGYISSLALPEQYTVRQISVTLKTIILGMSYLACFIYGANALGLFLLGVDMVMNPEKHKEEQ